MASWFAALVSVSILGSPTALPDQSIRFLLPESLLEACWWIRLSIVAGISEEALYRGYLQTQFTGLTNSHSMGIFGFGSRVHCGSAVLYGLVAKWRQSVRPGMFSHTLQDAIAPPLVRLLRH